VIGNTVELSDIEAVRSACQIVYSGKVYACLSVINLAIYQTEVHSELYQLEKLRIDNFKSSFPILKRCDLRAKLSIVGREVWGRWLLKLSIRSTVRNLCSSTWLLNSSRS
jgi:hypothetical protein